jgi:hypothetical protein
MPCRRAPCYHPPYIPYGWWDQYDFAGVRATSPNATESPSCFPATKDLQIVSTPATPFLCRAISAILPNGSLTHSMYSSSKLKLL